MVRCTGMRTHFLKFVLFLITPPSVPKSFGRVTDNLNNIGSLSPLFRHIDQLFPQLHRAHFFLLFR